MTTTRPFRRVTWQSRHIFFADARTFITENVIEISFDDVDCETSSKLDEICVHRLWIPRALWNGWVRWISRCP